MNADLHLRNWIWASIAIFVAVFVVRWLPALDVHAQTEDTEQPFISPLPTPAFLSQEAKIALDFISTHHNLPVDELQIVNEHTRTYPLIGRTFKAFTIWTQDPGKFQDFHLLVELESDVVEPDVKAISAQEQAAYQARYGRLTPDLYERLQQASDDELLPIAVWLAPDPAARTQKEIYAELAVRFPGAAESLVEFGVPWTVGDVATAETIRQTYFAMLAKDALHSMQPLAEQIASLGAKATTLEPLPSLFVQLSKRDILALAERKDIDLIYLLENEASPAMVEAAATDRMPTSWRQGSLSGAGRRIAVLEPTNIQNTGCLNVTASRAGVPPGSWTPDEIAHKTKVASVLACNHATYRGIAYNANVIDAGYNSASFNPDFAAGVQWAVQTQNADIINVSLQTNSTQSMQWEDRVLDYWVRYGPAIIVVAAGNNAVNVTSPAKGWNVITVGAIDDQGTATWSDDAMWGGSNYVNPTSTHNDREKPELVAPGATITMIGPGGNPSPHSGTSYAAPQVAGLAALLMNRNAALVDRSEAVKAVLMAGAAHNVRDSRVMPSGQDLYDGAGSIDAALSLQAAELGYAANNAATCDRPCWWATDSLYVAPGANVSRSFYATRGERVRVAIAWFSIVDPAYLLDYLSYNYDLQVLAPSGGQVIDGASAGWDASNELVEFVAPETGIYTIRATRSASDTSPDTNRLGIAWSKQASYLPDVRSGSGWENTLYVRNSDPTVRPAQIAFSRDNGDALGYLINPTLAGGVLWQESAAFYTAPASAVVDGSEELLALVRNRSVASNLIRLDNGFRSAAGDPAFEQAATTLYVPAFYRALFGNTNSTLDLFNPSPQGTYVTFEFRGRSGYGDYTTGSYWVPAGGRLRIEAETVPFSPWVGSVRILAGQPVAATVSERNAGFERSFNAAAAGHRLQYVPAAYKNAWNLTTGLVVQNGGSNPVNVTFTFCERLVTNPNSCPTYTSNNLAPLRALALNLENVGVLPSGWSGSVKITSSDNATPLVTIVNNGLKDASGALVDGYSFNASNYGGRWVYLPYAAHNADGRTTGFTLRNVSGAHLSGYAHYYDPDGTLRIAYPFTLASAQAMGRHQSGNGLPNGWVGSILLEASGPILAILREDAPGRSAGYNALVLAP
jgi:hypothetical protein